MTSGTSLDSEKDDECGSSSRGPRRRTLAVDTTVTTVEAATPERMAWLSPEENLKKSVSASMRPETDRLARTGSGGRTGRPERWLSREKCTSNLNKNQITLSLGRGIPSINLETWKAQPERASSVGERTRDTMASGGPAEWYNSLPPITRCVFSPPLHPALPIAGLLLTPQC